MSIESFVSAMLPEFDKQKIKAQLETTRRELIELAIPSYEAAVTWDKQFHFKSGTYDYLLTSIRSSIKVTGKTMPAMVLNCLKNANANLDILGALVDNQFQSEVTAASITYKKANILQLISGISMFVDMSLKMLNVLYIAESSQMSRTAFLAETQREFVWIKKNFSAWLATADVLNLPVKGVGNAIDSTSEMVVDPAKTMAYRQTVGATALSPFPSLNFSVILSPVYHISMRIAEWQVRRYKAAKVRKEILELRLLALQKEREGKKDAALEKQIVYTQGRINDLDLDIKDMEEGV